MIDDKTRADMQKWARRAKAFAVASVAFAAAAASIRKFAREGDALAKMSDRLGVAADRLSALRFAASGRELRSMLSKPASDVWRKRR